MFKKIALTTVFFSQVTFAQIADSTGPGRLLVTPPIASEGGPCNTNDVRSDANGNILYCQSGIWKPAKNSGGTGILGLLQPYRGMYLSCQVQSFAGAKYTVSGGLDANGNIILRAHNTECINSLGCSAGRKPPLSVSINAFGITGTLQDSEPTGDNGSISYIQTCESRFPLM